jgi:glycosyltransferase involved in cell wall biosynthesis
VGNLLLSKGAGVLIEACALLAGRGARFRCDLVGPGRDERRLRALTARYRLDEVVRFHGPQPLAELPDWYRAADVVALPSFSEGIPNVLREASACGRPFVATRVGGIPEITDPQVSRLVDPGATVEVADALQELLARGPAPSVASTRVPPITWEESARQLTDRLRAVVAEAGQAAPRPAILSSTP